MHGNVEKNMDDNIPIQRIPYFFQKTYTMWDFSNKLTFFNP